MKILAIESSSLVASVAIVEDEIMIAEYTVNFKKTHSQTLLPMIDEIVKMTEQDIATIDAIAISGGPGSFTGLRIGSATAKGLGLALEKPLVHVPTLDAMAYNLVGVEKVICPIMDARRNQVYTGIYSFENMKFKILEAQCAVGIDEIIEKLNIIGRDVIFIGDGIPVFEDYIKNHIKVNAQFATPNNNRQRAGSVATLALEYLKRGETLSASEHAPEYLRLSQAEREKNESQINASK